MDKYLIDQNDAYQRLKHEVETHELPASKEAYERAMHIISMMGVYHVVKEAMLHTMTQEEKADIKSMPIFNCKCGNCGAMCFCDDTYCSECGACFEDLV